MTHYWNPPYIITAVKVVPGRSTSAEAIEATVTLLKAVGKYPALVKKDVAGFVGNRLQHALRREAIAIVAQGIARLSFGLCLPVVGPLETVDLGGLDLTQAIQTYLLPELNRSTEPLPLIRESRAGRVGSESRHRILRLTSEPGCEGHSTTRRGPFGNGRVVEITRFPTNAV